jgi:hypothetical protein
VIAMAQQLQQTGQGGDVLAMNFHQFQFARFRLDNAAVDGFDQTALAHAAGPPQQGVVGGQVVGETAGVLEQGIALGLDALQKVQVDPADRQDRLQMSVIGVPDEGIGAVQINSIGAGRRQAVQGIGDAAQQRGQFSGIFDLGSGHFEDKPCAAMKAGT